MMQRTRTAVSDNVVMLMNCDSLYDLQAAPVNGRSYYLMPSDPFFNRGLRYSDLPTVDINGNQRVYDDLVDIGAVEYSMIYNQGSADWDNPAHWNIGRVPNAADVVTIEHSSEMKHLSSAPAQITIRKLIGIAPASKLQISQGRMLIVNTTINNSDPDRLILASCSEGQTPSGSLEFQNPQDQPVFATVMMHAKGFIDRSTPENEQFHWQYFGIPVASTTPLPTFEGAYVNVYNEAKATSAVGNQWDPIDENATLRAFQGYELTQDSAKLYTFKGRLVNQSFDTTLTLTRGSFYRGQHVLANPYTAAIRISQIEFGEGLEQNIYIYNTGSFTDWQSHTSSVAGRVTDMDNGQYLSVPQRQCETILSSISSMQGFIVKVRDPNKNTSLKINYAKPNLDGNNSTLKTAAARKVYSVVQVSSKSSSDRTWLFTDASCSSEFENGWDGYKIAGREGLVSLYSTDNENSYSVNSTNDINGVYLGFRAGYTDTEYTMTFHHENTDAKYNKIYLSDLKTGIVTDVTADSTTYTFYASNNDKAEKRFRILTQLDDRSEDTQDDLFVQLVGGNLFIDNNAADDGSFSLYDTTGRRIAQGTFGAHSMQPTSVGKVPAGVYLFDARYGNQHVSKKIISKD